MQTVTDMKAKDLAGPGIGDYTELEKILPTDYTSLLDVRETQEALFAAKDYIEEHLCEELNLMRVTVPLIVDKTSGVNDMLDRDGSRTPVEFQAGLGLDRKIDAQVVQAATKWKRMALRQFGCRHLEGICTDMRAVRKDYFLDHDHSSYVDQWDWERVIGDEERSLEFLKDTVGRIWKVLAGAARFAVEHYPQLRDERYGAFPEELEFIHAEDLLAMYPDLPRKERETKILQEHPAVFIIGIGWPLEDGYPHEMRAVDYDDWITETRADVPRPQRRHPRLEPGDAAAARAHVDGRPGHEGDAAQAVRDGGRARPPRPAVPPGDPRRRDPAQYRRRHRAEPHVHVAAAQGAPRRGQRHDLAGRVEAHLRGAEHSRAGVGAMRGLAAVVLLAGCAAPAD